MTTWPQRGDKSPTKNRMLLFNWAQPLAERESFHLTHAVHRDGQRSGDSIVRGDNNE